MASAIVRKTYHQQKADYYELCKQLAETAYQEYCRNAFQKLYVMGERGNLAIWSKLYIGKEDQPGLCAIQEHIPRNLIQENMIDWIMTRLNREPLYVFAD